MGDIKGPGGKTGTLAFIFGVTGRSHRKRGHVGVELFHRPADKRRIDAATEQRGDRNIGLQAQTNGFHQQPLGFLHRLVKSNCASLAGFRQRPVSFCADPSVMPLQ